MATYADLKARIITEMSRDDLADDLADILDQHVADACIEYSDMRFWFNQSIQAVATVAGTITVALPAPMRIIDRLAGPYADLTPVTLDDYPDYGDFAADATGLPSRYTYINGQLRFDITPDAVYNMTAYGLLQIDPPAVDATSNVWTNEARALIIARTKMTLARDVFRDQDGVVLAQAGVQDNLTKLQRETQRRLRTRSAAQLVRPNGQPVRRAYLDRL